MNVERMLTWIVGLLVVMIVNDLLQWIAIMYSVDDFLDLLIVLII